MTRFMCPSKRSGRKRAVNKFLSENYDLPGTVDPTSPPSKVARKASPVKSPTKPARGRGRPRKVAQAAPNKEDLASSKPAVATRTAAANDNVAPQASQSEPVVTAEPVTKNAVTAVVASKSEPAISVPVPKIVTPKLPVKVLRINLQKLDHSWPQSTKSALFGGKARIKVAKEGGGGGLVTVPVKSETRAKEKDDASSSLDKKHKPKIKSPELGDKKPKEKSLDKLKAKWADMESRSKNNSGKDQKVKVRHNSEKSKMKSPEMQPTVKPSSEQSSSNHQEEKLSPNITKPIGVMDTTKTIPKIPKIRHDSTESKPKPESTDHVKHERRKSESKEERREKRKSSDLKEDRHHHHHHSKKHKDSSRERHHSEKSEKEKTVPGSPMIPKKGLMEVDLFAGLDQPKKPVTISPKKRRESSTDKPKESPKSPRSEGKLHDRRASDEEKLDALTQAHLSYKPKKSWLEMAATDNYTAPPQPTFAGDNPWTPNFGDLTEENQTPVMESEFEPQEPRQQGPRKVSKKSEEIRRVNREKFMRDFAAQKEKERIEAIALEHLTKTMATPHVTDTADATPENVDTPPAVAEPEPNLKRLSDARISSDPRLMGATYMRGRSASEEQVESDRFDLAYGVNPFIFPQESVPAESNLVKRQSSKTRRESVKPSTEQKMQASLASLLSGLKDSGTEEEDSSPQPVIQIPAPRPVVHQQPKPAPPPAKPAVPAKTIPQNKPVPAEKIDPAKRKESLTFLLGGLSGSQKKEPDSESDSDEDVCKGTTDTKGKMSLSLSALLGNIRSEPEPEPPVPQISLPKQKPVAMQKPKPYPKLSSLNLDQLLPQAPPVPHRAAKPIPKLMDINFALPPNVASNAALFPNVAAGSPAPDAASSDEQNSVNSPASFVKDQSPAIQSPGGQVNLNFAKFVEKHEKQPFRPVQVPGAEKILPLMDMIAAPSHSKSLASRVKKGPVQDPSAPPMPLALMPRLPVPNAQLVSQTKGDASNSNENSRDDFPVRGSKIPPKAYAFEEGFEAISSSNSPSSSTGRTFTPEPSGDDVSLLQGIAERSRDRPKRPRDPDDVEDGELDSATGSSHSGRDTPDVRAEIEWKSKSIKREFSHESGGFKPFSRADRNGDDLLSPIKQGPLSHSYWDSYPGQTVEGENSLSNDNYWVTEESVVDNVKVEPGGRKEVFLAHSFAETAAQEPQTAGDGQTNYQTPDVKDDISETAERLETPSERVETPMETETVENDAMEVVNDVTVPTVVNENSQEPPPEAEQTTELDDAAKKLFRLPTKKIPLTSEAAASIVQNMIRNIKSSREITKAMMMSTDITVEEIVQPVLDLVEDEPSSPEVEGVSTVSEFDIRIAKERAAKGLRRLKKKSDGNFVSKKQPAAVAAWRGRNDVYVTHKTDFRALMSKCQLILDHGYGHLYLHGLGQAVNRTIELGLQVQKECGRPLKMSVHTCSQQLTDAFWSLDSNCSEPHTSTERNCSSVHVTLTALKRTAKSS